MASLISAADKAAIQSALSDVHDTFARDIFVYVKVVEPINVESDYHPLYGGRQATTSLGAENEFKKFTYKARVYYPSKQDEDQIGEADIDVSLGLVRVKVTSECYEKMKIASKIEVDDELWVMNGDAKPVGPFDPQFYMVFLKRAD